MLFPPFMICEFQKQYGAKIEFGLHGF